MIDISILKKKILSLAFQGKMTEQLPTDLGVDQIIDKCKEDKQRSIAEGKYKSEEFRGSISATYLGQEIPHNWRYMFISDMALFQEGPGILAVDFRTEGVPLIRIAGMNGKVVTLKGCNYLDPKMVEEKWKHFKLDVGDVVISSSASLDRIAEVDDEAAGAIPYTGLIRFKMYGGINKEYFKWFIKSPYYIEQVNSQKKGGFIQHYGPSHLRKMIIPIPPLEEQGRISEKLNEIFRYIEVIEKLQSEYSSNLEKLKSKVIDAGICGKLTEQLPEDGKVEDLCEEIQIEKAKILEGRKGREDKKIKAIESDMPFEIPSHWKWIRLGDVGLFKKGPFGSALTKSIFVQKGQDTVKVYEQQHAIKKDNELGTYYITREYFDEKMSGFEVVPGDIIISCAGTIGETYIMPDEIEQGIINQALMRVTLAEGINKKFFQYYFDANLKKSAQKESNGSAIKNIPPFDVLKNWYFPLTSIEEQGRIVEKIDELLNILD